MFYLPQRDLVDWYEEATGEPSESREDRGDTEGLYWEYEDEPDEQRSPGLVEGKVHQSKLKELYPIPSSTIHSLLYNSQSQPLLIYCMWLTST